MCIKAGTFGKSFTLSPTGLWEVGDRQRVCRDTGLQHGATHAVSGTDHSYLHSMLNGLASVQIVTK